MGKSDVDHKRERTREYRFDIDKTRTWLLSIGVWSASSGHRREHVYVQFVGSHETPTRFVLTTMYACDLSYTGSVRASTTREKQCWVHVPREVREQEGTIVRAGYQGIGMRYNCDEIHLDPSVRYPVQSFLPIDVNNTV